MRNRRSKHPARPRAPDKPRHRRLRLESLEPRIVLATFPLTSLPLLSSTPTANAKLFLDFDGHVESSWSTFNQMADGTPGIITPAFDQDDDRNTFSDAELLAINEIWARVAEDYAPFNVDVTTIDPLIPPANRNLVEFIIAIGGNSTDWHTGPAVAGISFTGSFYNSGPNVGYAFSDVEDGNPKNVAEIVAHEAGHGFGLLHQALWNGSTMVSEYHPGDANWGPIMGAPYNAVRSTWHDGQLALSQGGPSATQDDMAQLSSGAQLGAPHFNGVGNSGYKPDDFGSTTALASPLPATGNNVNFPGLIGQNGDLDVWSFAAQGGPISLQLNVAPFGPNLDAVLELQNSAGEPMLTSSPGDSFGASIATTLIAGNYYLVAMSSGGYGNVGQFTISGTLPPDITPPTADIVDVAPDPRNSTVNSVAINFTEPVTGLDLADFSLTRDGSPVLLSGLLLTGSDATYTLDLSGFTALGGSYVLTLNASGSQIIDAAGNPFSASATDTWLTDTTPPTADIIDIAPDPRNNSVGDVFINFTEPVTGLDLADFELTRDGEIVPLIGVDFDGTGASYMLNLNNVTGLAGIYVLTLVAAGCGVSDTAGNALTADAADTWLTDTTPPTADIVDIAPDPRNSLVGAVTINFNEPVTGVDLADFSLTRDGTPVLLTGPWLSGAGANYVLDLKHWTGTSGTYVLTLVASGSGIADTAGNLLSLNADDTWLAEVTLPLTIRYHNYDGAQVPKNGDGELYPSYFDGMGGGQFVATINTTDAVAGNSLQLSVQDVAGTEKHLYAQFNPYNYAGDPNFPQGPRGFARQYALDAAQWQFNTYDRMEFWVKVPANATPLVTDGQSNYQLGTYVKNVSNPDFLSDEAGGDHYYHGLNLPNGTEAGGQWTKVVINTHPTHRRTDNGSADPGNLPHPTGEANYNYFDAFTRWYFQQNEANSTFPATFLIDEIQFYKAPYSENEDQVYSISGVYNPANNRVLVSWNRHKNDNNVNHEVRYLIGPESQNPHAVGWNSLTAAPNGVITPPGVQGFNAMVYQSPAILGIVNAPGIWIAIKPQNSTDFSTIYVRNVNFDGVLDTTAPTASDIDATYIAAHDVTISWTTNELADTQVEYGATTAYGSLSALNSVPTTSHSVNLVDLAADTTYHYRVISRDLAGNSFNSQDFSFTTPNVSSLLVSSFAFDEGAGGQAKDSQGHIGAVNGPAWDLAGITGSALDFDGVDDLVTVPNSGDLQLTNAFTIAAWVRPTGTIGYRTVLMKESGGDFAYALYASTDTGLPGVGVSIGSSDVAVVGATPLSPDIWTHLAATFNGVTLKLYVNGNLVGSTDAVGALISSTGPLKIGGNSIWGEFFDGRIDNVRLYNGTLNDAEIDQLAADSVSPSAVIVAPPLDTGNSAFGIANITFNEPVTGVDLNDFTLLHDGQSVLLSGFPFSGSGTTYTLNLADVSTALGTYVLTLGASDSGITDAVGNLLGVDGQVSWQVETTPPAASIAGVTPDPRITAVSSLSITFSEPVTGVNVADFTLTRDGAPVSLVGVVLSGSQHFYTLDLSSATTQPGAYVLQLTAAGSGIVDAAGNALLGDAQTSWSSPAAIAAWLEGSQLVIQGTVLGDSIVLDEEAGFVRVVDHGTPAFVFASAAVASALITGGDGNDIISIAATFGARPATMLGGAGSDILIGGIGADLLDGGAGDDSLIGLGGGDNLQGGPGADTADYSASPAAVTVVLANAAAGSGGDAQGDVFAGIESLIGSAFPDYLYGNASPNSILGNGGADFIYGDAGDDSLVGGEGNDLLHGGLGTDAFDGGGGNDQIVADAADSAAPLGVLKILGGVGVDSLNLTAATIGISFDNNAAATGGFETIYGSSGNDNITNAGSMTPLYLIGLDGNDILIGGDANDYIDGGPGDDSLTGNGGNDFLTGSAGIDAFEAGAGNDQVIADAADSTAAPEILKILGGSGSDTLNFSAQIVGITFNNNVAATGGFEVLYGGLGNDNFTNAASPLSVYVAGFAGNDTLTGGDGNDYIDGGAGDDNLIGNGGNDSLLGGEGQDSLDGGGGFDNLNGGAGNDVLIGRAGADYVYGGAGDDTADYSASPAGVTITLGNGSLGIGGDAQSDFFVAIDNLVGSDFADYLYGTSTANSIDGRGGNDLIYGDAGNDNLTGGDGSDLLNGGQDIDTFEGGNGDDQIVADIADITAAQGALKIFGGGGTDFLNMSAQASNIFFDNNGSFTGGFETIYGGIGNDTITNAGSSTPLYLATFAGDDTLVGGEGNDYIDAGSGNDSLSGGGGNDTLLGSTGTDTFDGGTGDDQVIADFADVTAALGTLKVVGGEGRDYLNMAAVQTGVSFNNNNGSITGGFETIYGSQGDDILTNAGSATGVYFFGSGGNDTLIGGSGIDILEGYTGNDVLIGLEGGDWLDGGPGSDTADYSASPDGVNVDLGTPGYSSGGHAEGDFLVRIENLVGSNAADILFGELGANLIDGRDGADQIFGNAGDDDLTGGAGADFFDGGSGTDTVTDFSSGDGDTQTDVP